MGLFLWIREGVRRAVLLGFSDAVAELGRRSPDEDLGENLANGIRQRLALESEVKPSVSATTLSPPPSRKRLGKTLEQISSEKAA